MNIENKQKIPGGTGDFGSLSELSNAQLFYIGNKLVKKIRDTYAGFLFDGDADISLFNKVIPNEPIELYAEDSTSDYSLESAKNAINIDGYFDDYSFHCPDDVDELIEMGLIEPDGAGVSYPEIDDEYNDAGCDMSSPSELEHGVQSDLNDAFKDNLDKLHEEIKELPDIFYKLKDAWLKQFTPLAKHVFNPDEWEDGELGYGYKINAGVPFYTFYYVVDDFSFHSKVDEDIYDASELPEMELDGLISSSLSGVYDGYKNLDYNEFCDFLKIRLEGEA